MKILSSFFLLLVTFSSNAQDGFKSIGKKQYNNVYAAVIGISDYKQVQSLEYAHKDAQLFYDVLNLSFPEHKANFALVQNEKAHERAIKEAIYSAQKNAKEGDLVIIYFSGHGDVMLEPGSEEGFFLAHDASDSREYFIGGAVEFDWINKMTNLATSRKAEVWLVTDACHSGKVINQESAKATMTTLNSNFEKTTKFISCQAHELSYEYSSIQHGAFTYFLTKCLSGEGNSDGDGTLNVDEISSYLKKEVRVFTENKQSPKLSASNEFSPFFNVTPELASLVNEVDEYANSDMASRGKGEDDMVKSKELMRFENVLNNGDLYGSSNSALEILQSFRGSVQSDELDLMENLLIDALLNRAQRNTNIFLSGRPNVSKTESFMASSKDLRLAGDLLGKEHFLFLEIINKARFFEVMDIVQSENSDQYLESEKILLELQKRMPNAAYLNQGLGLLYMKMSDLEKADEQLEAAQAKVSTWSKPRNTSAYVNINFGNLDKAKEIIAESEKLASKDANVDVLKARMFSAGLELQSAELILENVSVEEGTVSETEYLMLKAKVNQLRGRISIAESLYIKALKKDNENIDLLIQLGDLYKSDGDTALALIYYKKVQNLDKNNLTSSNNIALLTSGLRASNKYKQNYYNIDEVLSTVDLEMANGNKKAASDLLVKTMKVVKNNAELDYALAKVYYSMENNDLAEVSLKNALKNSPYHFESIQSLAYLYILQKKFTEAQNLIKSHNDYFKYSAKWKVFTYEAYRKMQKTENAIFSLEEAIKLDPKDTEAYKSLYRLHMSEGNYNSAEKEYDRLHILGGRLRDSLDFISSLVNEVNARISNGRADNKAVSGLSLILKYDPNFLSRMLSNARKEYIKLDYRKADIYLEQYQKYLFAMQGEMKYEYFRIKAYLLLEVKMYKEALDLFMQVTRYSKRECYVGVAMAKYEMGHSEEGWLMYFKQAKDISDLNSKGVERYKKMKRNDGYYTPGGR